MNMQSFTTQVKKFLKDEEGLTTVEYAIAGALVGLAVVGAFTALGSAVGVTINKLKDCVTGAAGCTP